MDFDSFFHRRKTAHSCPDDPAIAPGKSAPASDAPYPTAIDLWNFLLALTADPPSTFTPGTESEYIEEYQRTPGKLTYFPAAAFDTTVDTPRLGEGAHYITTKSTLQHHGLAVAIKRPKLHGAPSDSVAKILREVRILTHAPLAHHAHIAALLGYASVADCVAARTEISLVAEYAPHGTLQAFLGARKAADAAADLLTAAKFAHDVASGLQALHRAGVLHGDVKTENTLVFDDPRGGDGWIAKVSGMGSAPVCMSVDTTDTAADAARYVGSATLNAPEIRDIMVSLERSKLFRCEAFSYGLLVWELLLDGARFFTTFSQEHDSSEGLVSTLNSLPKDELLRLALRTLGAKEGASDVAGVLKRVLAAALPDVPRERGTMADVVEIFRAQRQFRDDARPGPIKLYRHHHRK
ncbi:kinase-like domain-containing protein [Geopyxis carbonaria]|nr:kinase-like domain-containing protein [Geopyxis carbonaria]